MLEAAGQEMDVAASTGMTELMGWAQYGLTHGYALRGDLDAAFQAAEKSIGFTQENDSSFCAVSLMERGFAQMQASKYGDAIASFQESQTLVKKRFFYFEIVMYLYPRFVEALLGPHWLLGPQPKSCDARQAKKILRMARFFAISYPNIVPHTSRVAGRYHFVTGNRAKARKYLEKAVAQAQQLGAQYDHARALIDLGAAFPEYRERQAEGLQLLETLGAVMPAAEREVLV